MQKAEPKVASSVVPAWAQLSVAESRNLRKPEAAPATRSSREEEQILLKLFRKLRRGERLQVVLLASDLALFRIRRRLATDRGRRHG